MHKPTESAIEGESGSADDRNTSGDFEPNGGPETDRSNQADVESTEPDGPEELPLDETFELLRNQRRRYVLQYLQDADGQVTLSELAEQIAAWENDKEIRQITSSERKRVYVGLYQCHLPKMDGMGVISFNKARGHIERGRHADAAEPYLPSSRTTTRSSHGEPRVGLAVLGITVVPVAIALLSQSFLALGAAVLVTLAATAWGLLTIREESDSWPLMDSSDRSSA